MKKIFTLLLAFLALATGMQATDYGFKMLHEDITSDNYQRESAGKAWYYDPAANVLHLTEGTISTTISSATIIQIDGDVNPTLTIQVDGNCRITGTFLVGINFSGSGNHTLCGDGTLSMNTSLINSKGIQSSLTDKVCLTIKDVTININAWGESPVGFSNCGFSKIILDNCEMNIRTSCYAWAAFGGNGVSPVLNKCYLSNGNFTTSGSAVSSGEYLKEVYIKRTICVIDITVDEPVVGNKATTSCSINNSNEYYVSEVTWYGYANGSSYEMSDESVFKAGESYTVHVRLFPTEGHKFDNKDITIYVNGERTDEIYYLSEGGIRIDFTFPALVGTSYDLWVGGTQVTDANKEDVLGNGYVSYSPATSTLTLKGGTIKGNNTDSSANFRLGCGIYSEVDGLTIDVQGNTTVQGDYEKYYAGINLHLNTTITGTAQLTAKGQYGIIAGSSSGLTNLTIGGNVTVVAEGTGSCGLLGEYRYFKGKYTYYATLTIKDNSTVMAKGATNTTSLGLWQDFTLAGSHEITAPSGAKWNATTHNICYADGTAVKGEWVVIKRLGALKGDVNLDGDVTIADGVAVLNAMAGQSVPGNPDINGDNDITIADFVAVLNIMAGQ